MGTCHATASPFAVSKPTERLARIPGPRVTDMKSGFCFDSHVPESSGTLKGRCSAGFDDDAAGRCSRDVEISLARFF